MENWWKISQTQKCMTCTSQNNNFISINNCFQVHKCKKMKLKQSDKLLWYECMRKKCINAYAKEILRPDFQIILKKIHTKYQSI